MRDKILKYGKLSSSDNLFLDVCFFIFGFIMSMAKIAGFNSPFCVCFSMALKKRASMFSLFGSVFGIALFLNAENFIYVFILLFCFGVKLIFNFNSAFKNAVCAAFCFFVPHIISVFIFPVGFGTILILYFETILCAGLTALFTQTMKNFSVNFKDRTYDFLGFLMIGLVFLISLCSVDVFGFNLGRIFAAFIMVQVFLVAGCLEASAMGVITTISFVLFTKDFAKFGATLAVAGFVAGLFRSTAKIYQISMFFGTYFFCCVFFGGLNIQSLIEVIFVCFLNILLPKGFIYNIFAKRNFSKKQESNLNDELALKLKFASNVLIDLQENIKKCAKVMDSLILEGSEKIYDSVSKEVCKDCGLNNICWVTHYNEIIRAFDEIFSIIKKDGKIKIMDLPLFLKQKCPRQAILVDHINFLYDEYLCFEENSRRVNEVRAIAAEHFSSMSELLLDMSGDVSSIRKIDYENTGYVRNLLKQRNIDFKGILCFQDKYNRTIVDLYTDFMFNKHQIEFLTRLITRVVGKDMELPTITKAFSNYKISFFEAAILDIDFAVKQSSANNNIYCGDSYEYFMDGKGFAHIVLSDGMGNGQRAALDSLMTCSTLRKFIEAGFGFNSALKLLNLSFAIKSKEESLATVDTCTIDLYTGQVNFIKAGATSSYIICSGKTTVFVSKSLPIGIIQGIGFDREKATLSKGDVVVMVSDGATASGADWIEKRLSTIYKNSADYIAEEILDMAKKRENKNHLDDITVVVAKIV